MGTQKTPPAAWKPGQSGNPKGRPKGALNRTTRAVLALMEGDAENITRIAIDAAKAGDMTAVRLILDRLVPVAKERPVYFPRLPDTATAAGVSEAQQRVIQAVASGALMPSEGATLASMLETRRRALETEQLAARIAALENTDQSKDQ